MSRSRPAALVALLSLAACALARPAPAAAQQDTTSSSSGAATAAGGSDSASNASAAETLGVPGVGSPAPAGAAAAGRDASQRDVSTYRDTDMSGVDTSRARARDTTTMRDTTASRDTTGTRPAARPGDAAASDTSSRRDVEDRTGRATGASAAGAGAGRTTALAPLTDAQCDSIARGVAAGATPPAGTRAPAMQTWMVPDGPPPADLRSRTVMLRFRVDEGGVPVASTLQIDGSRDPAFRQRAVAALQRMQYVPADYRGCALPSLVELPVAFNASDTTAAARPTSRVKRPASKRPAAKPPTTKRAAPKKR